MCDQCPESYSRCLNCGSITQNKKVDYEYTTETYSTTPPTKTRINKKLRSLLKKDLEVLDYGGGIGRLAHTLKSEGYRTDYYEKSRPAQRLARKHFGIAQAKLNKKYDIIILVDVIEHFHNPERNVEELKKLLKKDGVIYVETPNADDPIARLRGGKWQQLHEDHVTLHTPKSLKRLFQGMIVDVSKEKDVALPFLYWLCYLKQKMLGRTVKFMGRPVQFHFSRKLVCTARKT